jgi:hypothetical protein
MKLAAAIMLGLAVALLTVLTVGAITPILTERTRMSLLLLGCFLFLGVCVLVCVLVVSASDAGRVPTTGGG